MALQVAEGWDTLVNPEDKYAIESTGYVNVIDTDFASGRQCLAITSAKWLKINLPTPTNAGVFGFAIKVVQNSSTISGPGVMLYAGSTRMGYLPLYNFAEWQWRDGNGGRLASCHRVIPQEVWFFVEVKFSISNSIAADSCIMKINGEVVMNLPATTDTETEVTDLVDTIMFDQDDIRVDNFYFCDLSGLQCNDFLGPLACDYLLPDGNGNQNDFTGSDADSTDNYLHVDDVEQDGDTSYTESSTVDHIDLYTFANLVNTPDTIYAVITEVYANKDDSGARTGNLLTRVNGTNYEGSAFTPVEADYDYFSKIWELNPDDSAAWEMGDVSGAEFGVKVES